MGAITSPFAKLRASLPPLAPEPAPIDTSGMDTGPIPAFPSTPPKVKLAPFNPMTASPEEVAMRPALARLRSDEEKDINPWGTPQNHPGFWGKFGHALSVATGGPNRRQFEEMGLQKSLQNLLNQQTSNRNVESEIPLHGAQTREANARANALEHPEPKEDRPYTIQTDEGVLQWNPEKNTWTPIQVNGDTAMPFTKPGAGVNFQHVAGTSGGKQIYANYDPQKGQFTDIQGNVLTDFKPADKAMQGVLGQYAPVRLLQGLLNTAYNDNPALLPIVGKLAAQIMGQYGVSPSQAETTLGATPAGQPQSSEGGAIGLRMPEAPTSTTRTRGQFAAEVLPTMQEAGAEVDRLGDKLGPFAGRYSELVTGKIGAYGPEFSGLQTDMHNIATAWGRLHGNSVETMKAFLDDLNSSKDPANLKEKLAHYAHQAEIYKAGGTGKSNASETPSQKRYQLNGKEIVVQGGKWVYKDTGKVVE